jgi:hypothetical protein
LPAEKTLLDSLKQRLGELKEKAAFVTAHAAALALTADNVSPDNETIVDAALAAYTELSEGAKALAAAEKALLDNLKITIADLRAAEGADEADKAAAAAFVSAHEAILGKTADTIAVADESSVDAALAAYNALTPQVKALVGARKALLDSLKTKITDTKTAAAFRTEHAVVLAKDPATAAIADEAGVDAVLAAYDALSAGAKAMLSPEKAALDALKQNIVALKEAAAFAAAHAAVLGKTAGSIAVVDEPAVDAALAAYNVLNAQVKTLLAKQKTLLDSLKEKIDEIKAPTAADEFRTAHAAVLTKTTGSIAVGDETAVNAALLAYNSLSAAAKAFVSAEKTLLDSLRQTIMILKDAAVDQNEADLFRANHAAILLKTISTVVISDEAAVDAALAAYTALRLGAQTLASTEKSNLDQLKAKITERITREGIFTAADLAKIGVDPAYPATGSYTLMADLTLNDWTPLCPDEAHAFSGTFDGNSHMITITGFNNAAVQSKSYIGIFGYVKGTSPSAKAFIRNVKVSSSVESSSEHDGGQSIGLIAGYANMAMIENIALQGSLRFSSLIGVVYVGGVAGWIEYEAVVKDCDSSMNINVGGGYDVPLDPNIVVYNSIGGFVGLFKHNSEIRGCHNAGSVSGGASRPSDALVDSRGGTTDLPGDFMGGGGSANDPNHAQAYVGGIAGGSYFGFVAGESGGIYDCSSYGDITAGAGGYWAFAAGISGCFQGAVRMERCVAGGIIKASSQYAYAGGMTAYSDNNAVFYRCSFFGAIAPFNYYTYGPITGQYGNIIECEWNTPAPQAIINFNGKLDGLVANTQYVVNNISKRADASGQISIEEAWFGSTIAIKMASQIDSLSQDLAVPLRPAAPTGLSSGSNSISGVKASMEWAPFGTAGWNTAAWTACAGTSVVGLAPGTYYVRYKHTATAFASANAVVAISLSIMSAADLAKIGVDPAYPVNGAYSLGADIALSNWTPLKFTGNLNGNGHRITIESINSVAEPNLQVPHLLANYVGIFSTIRGLSYDAPVTIENLNINIGSGAYAGLDGLQLDGFIEFAGPYMGTLAGAVEFVLLRNIHVDGAAITFNVESDYVIVGGIVGRVYSDDIDGGGIASSVFRECSNSAAITVTAGTVGGIAGSLTSMSGAITSPSPILVDACYATGTITTSSSANAGGIVGAIFSYNTVRRSYFAGSITGSGGSIGGIVGRTQHHATIEDCHSSGVFAGAGVLGGIVGHQWGTGAATQRCYSTAELNVQGNSAYAGGIIGFSEVVGIEAILQTTRCVALNAGINVEYASGFGLHRVLGAKSGIPLLTRNIAWSSMPLATTQTGQPAQPFTETAADKTQSGVAGGDCDQKPTQQDYMTLGWDFGAVWQMGSNGYPELR